MADLPPEVQVLRMVLQDPTRGAYVLGGPDGRTPVPASLRTVALFALDRPDARRVGRTLVPGGYVSTVFLFHDHSYSRAGPPVLFETMVFGGPLDDHQLRYHTYSEAEAGHAVVVAEVRSHYTWVGWHWGRLREWVGGIPDAIARYYRKRHERQRSDARGAGDERRDLEAHPPGRQVPPPDGEAPAGPG